MYLIHWLIDWYIVSLVCWILVCSVREGHRVRLGMVLGVVFIVVGGFLLVAMDAVLMGRAGASFIVVLWPVYIVASWLQWSCEGTVYSTSFCDGNSWIIGSFLLNFCRSCICGRPFCPICHVLLVIVSHFVLWIILNCSWVLCFKWFGLAVLRNC